MWRARRPSRVASLWTRPPLRTPPPRTRRPRRGICTTGWARRALPLSLRQPALLTLEGFAPAEIADMLGLNPNAVSIRLTRAKAALREALNPTPSQEVRP